MKEHEEIEFTGCQCDKCGDNTECDQHTCPYQAEINDDFSTCNCCENCLQQCCDDI